MEGGLMKERCNKKENSRPRSMRNRQERWGNKCWQMAEHVALLLADCGVLPGITNGFGRETGPVKEEER
jgi:hypothetical protein